MTNSGKLTIAGQDLSLFLTEDDINKLMSAIKSVGTVQAPTPSIQTVINNSGDYAVTSITAKNINNNVRIFNIDAKNVKEIGYGTHPEIWYPFTSSLINVPSDSMWIIVLKFTNNSSTTINLDGRTGSFQLTGDNSIIKEETITVVDSTVHPVTDQQTNTSNVISGKYQETSAELNKIYDSTEKLRLHFTTHGDHINNYYYCLKQNGKIIYENLSERPPRANDRTVDYMGDHPLESQFPISNGQYELYVKNLNTEPIIFGVITKDQYIQYQPGGLQYADWWKKLSFNQESTYNFYAEELSKKDAVQKGWQGDTAFFVTRPFYFEGKLCVEEIRAVNYTNGVELPKEGSRTIRFYSAVDSSKNISIEFITNGEHNTAKFRVLEKNKLDIDPNHFMVTCYNTTLTKFFCHDAVSFPDNLVS